MRHTSLILIAICLLLACSREDTSVRQRFLAQSSVSVQFENWSRVFNNMDQDSLALIYHQVRELRVVHSDGSMSRGWTEERERLSEFFNAVERLNLVTEGLETEVINKDLVLATFRYDLSVQRVDGQRDPRLSGPGTMVWIKDPADEIWKIHMEHRSAR